MDAIFLTLFTNYIMPAMGTVILSLGTYCAFLINKKLKNDEVKLASDMLVGVTASVVQGLNQTIAPTLRDTKGMLSDDSKQSIRVMAIDMIKAQMQNGMLDVLEKSGVDVEGKILTEIEANVYMVKQCNIIE